MTVLAFAATASLLAALALLARQVPRASAAIGFAGLVSAGLAASAIGPDDVVVVGGLQVAGSGYLRLFLVLGCAVGLLLAIVGHLATRRRDLPAAMLLGLAATAVALAVRDPAVGVLAVTAGTLLVILVTTGVIEPGIRTPVAIREIRAAVLAAALTLAAFAVLARSSAGGPGPVAAGIALVGIAAAVGLRFGAIPFHLRAARLPDTAGTAVVPALLVWGPAAFALIALGLLEPSVTRLSEPLAGERALVAGIGALGFVLGLVAAIVHDDLDHVVAYSIVADAGVALLAIASLDASAAAAARTWIVAFVVSKSALAAWAIAVRGTFGTSRLSSLSGWAGRVPILGLALVLLAMATVGWPGMALFDARVTITGLALGDGLGLVLVLANFGALIYFGRILAVGIGPRSAAVAAASGTAHPLLPADVAARVASRVRLPGTSRALAGTPRASVASGAVALLAALSLAVASGGLGIGEAAAANGPTESITLGAANGGRNLPAP